MSKQPSACLPLTACEDLETTAHASMGRDREALTGLRSPIIPTDMTGPSRLPLRAACGRP
jgi:hypothetical protein